MEVACLETYLVTGRYDFSKEEFLTRIRTACCNGVSIVQLREKELETRDYYQLAQEVKVICDEYQIPLIIDDRLDICLAVDAAGIHIGDKDLPVDIARSILGPNKIIGVSVKTLERANEAMDQGADYFGVGAIYPTATKDTARVSLETLTSICANSEVPVVAIGGLKVDNIAHLKGTGIAGVAVVSEIMLARNVAEKVQELQNTIQEVINHD
ncbi:thiamine-phosphate diphosphorylase [Granulicatella balaenopterae]|uniref:Thiamine-phosphate synthase n=1 Tax=Granulicatella balaenopterae TaxID=137733 RepID=A0A1H9MI74_9LACT|nr:thiamine phosphate synthase [Granulicatella balaenopterae]SER23392.1 thiamine-phosphate diphosphorylase [Granulicatella balaenopterae]